MEITGFVSTEKTMWLQAPVTLFLDLIAYANEKVSGKGIPYTEREAAASLMIDRMNGNKVGYRTYAKIWKWSEKQVRARLEQLNKVAEMWCPFLSENEAPQQENQGRSKGALGAQQGRKNSPQNDLNEDLGRSDGALGAQQGRTSLKEINIPTYLPSNEAALNDELAPVVEANSNPKKPSEFSLPDFNFSKEESEILNSDRAKTVLAAWIASGSRVDDLYRLTFGARYNGERVTYRQPNGFELPRIIQLSQTYKPNELATAFICASAKNRTLASIEGFIKHWKNRPSETKSTEITIHQSNLSQRQNETHKHNAAPATTTANRVDQAMRIAERIKASVRV